jgi:hypothetical protein
MLVVGKRGDALSRYPETHPKLRSGAGGGLLAAFAPSWASIYLIVATDLSLTRACCLVFFACTRSGHRK